MATLTFTSTATSYRHATCSHSHDFCTGQRRREPLAKLSHRLAKPSKILVLTTILAITGITNPLYGDEPCLQGHRTNGTHATDLPSLAARVDDLPGRERPLERPEDHPLEGLSRTRLLIPGQPQHERELVDLVQFSQNDALGLA